MKLIKNIEIPEPKRNLVVEYLPGIHKALGSIPQAPQKQNKNTDSRV
jgi:hypothetical protein